MNLSFGGNFLETFFFIKFIFYICRIAFNFKKVTKMIMY